MIKKINALIVSVTLFCTLLITPCTAKTTQSPESLIKQINAQNYMIEGDIKNAIVEFNNLLSLKPDADTVAYALYNLGLLYILQEQIDESNNCFSKLIIDHLNSIWTKLALKYQITEDVLFNISDKLYSNGEERAIELMDEVVQRFPDTKRTGEILYKTALLCKKYNLLEQMVDRLTELRSKYADTSWAKLAEIEAKKNEPLKQVEEILALKGLGDEKYNASIRILITYLQGNPKKEEIPEVYYQIAYSYLSMDSEISEIDALKYLEKFYQEYPTSPKAPEALFWIGEINYKAQKPNLAKSAFDNLLKNYAQSPRAKEAQEWANWKVDAKIQEQLFTILKNLVLTLTNDTPKGFGCKVFYEAPNKPPVLEGEFALQKYMLFALKTPQKDIKVVSNKDGFFIYLASENRLYKSAEVSAPLIPQLRFNIDKLNKEVHVNFDFNTDPKASLLITNVKGDDDLKFIVEKMKLNTRHIRISPAKDSQTIEIVTPVVDPIPPERIKINISSKFHVNQVVYTHYDEKAGNPMNLRFENIKLNEDIPYNNFDFQPPPKVDVVPIDKAPFSVIIATIMEMISTFIQ